MLWNVLLKAFAFRVNWSTKNCSQTQNFPFRYFKMFYLKFHNQNILLLPNPLFSLPQSEVFFFSFLSHCSTSSFLSPTVSGFPAWRYFFPWHVITMQLLYPVGRLYFAVQKQLHSPVCKRPKLEIRWDPPAAQRDTAYPKQKQSVLKGMHFLCMN